MNKIKDIFLRYSILFLVALPNLFIFYFIFTPLTIFPLFTLFKLFFSNISLIDNSFFISNKFLIEIIPACIAGAAYYLLLILNLSLQNIKLKKRIKMILFSFSLLLFLNIFRIFFLTILFIKDYSSFESIHKIFWYIGESVFVVLIWFIQIKTFKIKQIPLYLDISYLLKKIKKTKTNKKNN